MGIFTTRSCVKHWVQVSMFIETFDVNWMRCLVFTTSQSKELKNRKAVYCCRTKKDMRQATRLLRATSCQCGTQLTSLWSQNIPQRCSRKSTKKNWRKRRKALVCFMMERDDDATSKAQIKTNAKKEGAVDIAFAKKEIKREKEAVSRKIKIVFYMCSKWSARVEKKWPILQAVRWNASNCGGLYSENNGEWEQDEV